MGHLKAFVAMTLVFAILGTISSLAIPVPISLAVIFLNALILGAMIGGLGVLFRKTVFTKLPSEQIAYALSAGLGTLVIFVVFAMLGMNGGSLMAAVVSVFFGALSGFVGSLAIKIGR